MITNPILPIWLMSIICTVLLLLKRKGFKPYIRQIIIVILLFLINLRILIPSEQSQGQVQNYKANILFVIDDTISMIARDYQGETERLTAVYQDCEYIIDELYGAKFSVISFHNTTQVLAPYTNDADFIKSVIRSIYPLDPMWAQGSSMNTCKMRMRRSLQGAKEKQDGKVILFFISDGEITNGDKLGSFHEIEDFIDYGAVLGYGTKKGGKMYIKDSYSGTFNVVRDYTSSSFDDAISRIDESNLEQLASDMDISYVNMNDRDGIDDVIQSIKNGCVVTTGDKSTSGYLETYYVFAILVAALLLYEFVHFKRRL